MGSITDKLQKVINTKQRIKESIIAKGVEVLDTDKFSIYADKISEIQTGGKIENLLCGKYVENPLQISTASEYLNSMGVVSVSKSVKITLYKDTQTGSHMYDTSTVIPALKEMFDENLSYNTESEENDEECVLKLYKNNIKNGFVICCKKCINVDDTLVITTKLMINGVADETVIYEKTIGTLNEIILNFVKTSSGEIWGINDLLNDWFYKFKDYPEKVVKDLFAVTTSAENIISGEKTFLHCLSDINSDNNISFIKFSDDTTELTHSLSEKAKEFEYITNSDYIILENLYFYGENLKTDNLFITKQFPERNKSMSFAMNKNEFFSSKTKLDTQARFVFLKN